MTILLIVLKGETWGIYALVVGTVGGYLPEAVLLAWSLKRHGFSLIPCWRGRDADTKQVITQYGSMATSALLMGSTAIVNQAMAATLGSGSVATLNYGKKVVSFLLGIGSLTLSTAVLPHFSRMVALRDWSGVRHTFRTYMFFTVLVTIPFTTVLIYWSQPIVYLLFQRGSFTEVDTYLVSRVQTYSFLQIPFYVLGIFGVRLLSALARNQTLLMISGINLVTNVLGNYVFIQFFGVAGISLSTSTVYAIAMLLVFSALFVILKNRETLHQ
jgi:putative peptidoglycan lipid II flippase